MVALLKSSLRQTLEKMVCLDKVKMAYTRWYKNANPDSYKEFGLKGFTTEMRTGLNCTNEKSTDLEIKYAPTMALQFYKRTWN